MKRIILYNFLAILLILIIILTSCFFLNINGKKEIIDNGDLKLFVNYENSNMMKNKYPPYILKENYSSNKECLKFTVSNISNYNIKYYIELFSDSNSNKLREKLSYYLIRSKELLTVNKMVTTKNNIIENNIINPNEKINYSLCIILNNKEDFNKYIYSYSINIIGIK